MDGTVPKGAALSLALLERAYGRVLGEINSIRRPFAHAGCASFKFSLPGTRSAICARMALPSRICHVPQRNLGPFVVSAVLIETVIRYHRIFPGNHIEKAPL